MKKILSVLISLLLLSCLSLSVYAASPSITLSEDLQTLTIDGETYHRMDTSSLDYWYGEDYTVQLTDAQKTQLKDVNVTLDPEQIVADVFMYFRDGSTLYCSYVKDSHREQLTDLIEGSQTEAQVDFYWPEDTIVSAPIDDFKGTPVQLGSYELNYCDWFTVYGSVSELEVRSIIGSLLVEQGKYYYVDFAEHPQIIPYDFYPPDYDTLNAYEITDEALLQELEIAVNEYYSDGTGIFYDDSFTENLSTVVLVLIFGVIPGAVLVLAVIFLIRRKGYQRLTWSITAGFAAAELVVFVILTVIIRTI